MWWQIRMLSGWGALAGAPGRRMSAPLGLEGRPQGAPLRRLLFAERRGRVVVESSPRRFWVLRGRKLVGVSFNSSSASDVARPSALRAAN